MRKFLLKLTAFAAVLVVVLSLCELGFRLKPTAFKDKYEGLEKYAPEIEILALGHSHANEGFDPRQFDHRAYNMALGFQNVYFDDFILSKFIDRMDSLKCVVIATSYYHFFNPIPELENMHGEDLFNTIKFHLYWGVDEIRGKKISKLNPEYNLEILNNPASAWIAMAKYYLTGEAWSKERISARNEYLKYGFSGQYVEHDDAFLDSDGQKTAVAHTPSRDENRTFDGSFNYAHYEHIVKICAEKGVKVAIMLYPTWHTYQETVDARQMAETRRLMAQLAEEYSNCMVFDYMDDTRFEPHDFHDAIHLNVYGAEKMSAILNEKLISVNDIADEPK